MAFKSSCPTGFLENGTCYCTKDDYYGTSKNNDIDLQRVNPDCDVLCDRIIHGFNPSLNGRCECPGTMAGKLCDRPVCHYAPSAYYDELYYQLFCLDDSSTSSVENCTKVANLGTRGAKSFPACPCLNGGSRIEGSTNTSCQCAGGYYGDLCHLGAPVRFAPSPWGTIGVAAFIATIFALIGIALWYRKRQRKKYYEKMYQLEPITPGHVVDTFGALEEPPPEVPPGLAAQDAEGGEGSAERTPRRKGRRQTLAEIFTNVTSGVVGRGRRRSRAPKGPTVFEGDGGGAGGGQQTSSAAVDDQFGSAPQNYTTGMGFT